MPKKTLWRWLEKLEKAHRISRFSDLKNVDVSTSTGAVKTTFYNLNVLNQLAMACIDNENLNDISCKFSDMLSELEEYQRISRLSDLTNVDIPTETGAVKTTIYNLNVLNQLAMICIESDVLNETSKRFSDDSSKTRNCQLIQL